MSILHVRNVPNDLYERIRQQAQQHNRSISAEVITLLGRALDNSQVSQEKLLEGIQRRRFYQPVEHGAPESVTMIREDRAR